MRDVCIGSNVFFFDFPIILLPTGCVMTISITSSRTNLSFLPIQGPMILRHELLAMLLIRPILAECLPPLSHIIILNLRLTTSILPNLPLVMIAF